MLAQLDNALQRTFGLPYLFASRDFNIHSRCRYLLHKLERVEGYGLSFLDVGCGAGITLRHLATLPSGRISRYVGIDQRAERLEARYRDVRGIGKTFHNIDLDDDWDVGRFDLVWCSEVIEHLMDDAGQIEKMKRAVKPGGLVLITTPCLDFVQEMGKRFPPILKTSPTQDGGHVRHGYRALDMERLAAGAGLEVESIDGVNRLTRAETEKRYTTRGVSWIINNTRMSWRARGRLDFAIGDGFRAEAARYASIGAVLRRPVEAVQARPKPESMRAPLPERVGAELVRTGAWMTPD
ncbi:MAG: class I SAM-dependent methyltransferase [Alphaproteobacteria bacterium]